MYLARLRNKTIYATLRSVLVLPFFGAGFDEIAGKPIRATAARIFSSLEVAEVVRIRSSFRPQAIAMTHLRSRRAIKASKYCFWYARSHRNADSRVYFAFKYLICTIRPLHSRLCCCFSATSCWSSLQRPAIRQPHPSPHP